jgi:hypothetical protein
MTQSNDSEETSVNERLRGGEGDHDQWLINWNTNEMSGWPTSARSRSSWLFFNSAFVKWFHVLPSPYSSAGALVTCRPSLHRLHLYVSCVSDSVSSRNRNSCRSASIEKCRSASSFSSTTASESACFDACR